MIGFRPLCWMHTCPCPSWASKNPHRLKLQSVNNVHPGFNQSDFWSWSRPMCAHLVQHIKTLSELKHHCHVHKFRHLCKLQVTFLHWEIVTYRTTLVRSCIESSQCHYMRPLLGLNALNLQRRDSTTLLVWLESAIPTITSYTLPM